MSTKGVTARRKKAWTDPAPGTWVHSTLQSLLSPRGYVRDIVDRKRASQAIRYLTDMCGYDIRRVGREPGAWGVRKNGRRYRMWRYVYRAVGRIGFTADQPYQDFLAADLFGKDRAA